MLFCDACCSKCAALSAKRSTGGGGWGGSSRSAGVCTAEFPRMDRSGPRSPKRSPARGADRRCCLPFHTRRLHRCNSSYTLRSRNPGRERSSPLPAGPALGGIRGPSRRSVSAPSAPVTLRKLSGCAGFAAGIPRPINGCGPAIRQLHPQRHARRKQNAVQQYFSRRFGHDLPVLPNPVYDFLLVCAASPVSCFPPPFVKDPAFSASWLSQYKSARMPASTLAVRSSSS